MGTYFLLQAFGSGNCLEIVPESIRRDPFKLAKYYDDNKVESSFVPPRLIAFMLEHNKSLKHIIVESVLKCGQVGRNDDFFLLGGDSVKVVETINILGDLPVDTEMFFKGRPPERIVALIENNEDSDKNSEVGFEKTKKSVYPLTSSQLGVYFAMAEDPNTLMYNNPIVIRLTSPGNEADAAGKTSPGNACCLY